MISEYKEIQELWDELENHLKEPIKIFTIGGAVLVYQGLKPATKDIDFIISNKKEYDHFSTILKSMGFIKRNPTGVYTKLFTSGIFERKDFRLDIFLNSVCKKLYLSNEMMKRAQIIIEKPKLKVYHCTNEDIFIFKSMTEREGDLEDNIALAQTGLNWNIILEELQSQIKQYGDDVWITWIVERFDLLEEKGLEIPIMNEINLLREKYFLNLEKKYLE